MERSAAAHHGSRRSDNEHARALEPWKGPDDLSAKVWLRWDERNLYLAARVRDDAAGFNDARPQEFASDTLTRRMLFDLYFHGRGEFRWDHLAIGGTAWRHGATTARDQGQIQSARIAVRRAGRNGL